MASSTDIEAYARQDYKDDTEYWERRIKTATGTMKKLADYVVSVGRG